MQFFIDLSEVNGTNCDGNRPQQQRLADSFSKGRYRLPCSFVPESQQRCVRCSIKRQVEWEMWARRRHLQDAQEDVVPFRVLLRLDVTIE